AEQKIETESTVTAKVDAIFSLKVCDPACGTGAFLIAAMNYLGKELAKIRTGQSEPPDDDIKKARREVLQHCIYGVDKNPMAVELAKVSLWIDSAVENLPLNFLDHHIKCGDSLIGATPEMLKAGIPDEAFKRASDDTSEVVRIYKQQNRREHTQRTIDEGGADYTIRCAEAYERLANLMEQNVADVYQKKTLYDKIITSPEWKDQKFAADALCAVFFWKFTTGTPPPPTEAILRILKTNPQSGAVSKVTRDEILRLREQYRFFHWWLEFPDVFGRSNSGFDVILGNPPFLGGLKISGVYGDKYRNYLSCAYTPFKGTADLCGLFFRRAFEILRTNGEFGLIATNTIGQGDTRVSGLAHLVKRGCNITFAKKFVKWPGDPSVEVNLITVVKGIWQSKMVLDEIDVEYISSRLDNLLESEPKILVQNRNRAFIGYNVRGSGFILDQDEATTLIKKDPKNADCLIKYINGDILNTNPKQNTDKYVIYFRDWSLEKAKSYPDLINIVEERVKPARLRLRPTTSDYRKLRKYWWHFSRFALEMQNATESLSRIMVRSQVCDRHMIEFLPKGWIYSHKVIIFAYDDYYHFSLIQSTIHELWIRQFTSTLRTDVSYAPSDCFETFPFPQAHTPESILTLENVGIEYYQHRRQIMLNRGIGLTQTYTLLNDPNCIDSDIQELRDLHIEMDNAVLACYGWEDVELKHDFYQNERGQTRFTISPEARIELLNRLLELNLSIAEQEKQEENEANE
ncbi:MAG TPA: hypothetical protein ENO00_03625, partial [Deltaproteobacteria bacterium]|nr:hypothetical protein [Deltaproteobacteria bacterium]